MSVLAPWFLLGLTALAVPILLHLTRRRARQTVDFPSLMFLNKVPYRSLRRRRIEQLALLVMRCSALALLAFAFARPLIPGSALGAATVDRTEVIVAIDRSLSMAANGRWNRAVAEARSALEGIGESDVAHLVAFDRAAEIVAGGAEGPQAALSALDDLQPTARDTDYRQAIELVRRLVLDSELPAQEVVMITDLQRRGFADSEDLEPLPRQVGVRVVDVGDDLGAEWVNFVVSEAEFERRVEDGREQVQALVRVRNSGTVAGSATVALLLDDRQIAAEEVEAEPLESPMISFEPFLLDESKDTRARIAVSSETDVLGADDEHIAILSPSQGIGVLVVDGNDRQRADSLFLEKSLAFSKSPLFRVQKVRANGLGPELLARSQVVVLNDAMADLTADSWREVGRFLERGGGLLLSVGRQFQGLPGAAAAVDLPSVVPANRSERRRRRLALLDYGHAALSPFQQPRSGDFTGAVFYQRTVIEPRDSDRVLARFDDGSVALLETARPEGAGRIVLFSSSFDTEWNDLALQPVFLPLVHRLAAYLAGFAPPPAAYSVGQIASLAAEAPGDWLVTSPDGEQEQQTFEREVLVELGQKGIYEVRAIDGADTEVLLAANPPLPESDLARLDGEEFAASVGGGGTDPDGERQEAAADDGATDEAAGLQLWWLLLIAAAALLITESVLSAKRSATLRPPEATPSL